ncbi:MAG: MAPEG family protein [Alphaproteobacteria bacterium]
MTPPLAAVALWAGLLALLYLALALPVVVRRRRAQIGLGTGGDQVLLRAVRVHGNFAEYVPLALVLMILAATARWGSLYMHALGATLLVARVLHAIGVWRHDGRSAGRFLGTLLTWIVTAIAALLCLVAALGWR